MARFWPSAMADLRRWKSFLGYFDSVDAGIEAADPDLCRDEFRRARGDIVQLLCDAGDDDQAERLCRVLDDVMAEALETLRLVPAMAKVLASTDLAVAVGGLRNHDSERVRLLASGIMSAWKVSVQDELAKAQAVLEKLEKMQQQPEKTAKKSTNTPEPSAKKMATVADIDRDRTAKIAQPPLHKSRVPEAGSMDARSKVTNPPLPTKTPLPAAILHGGRAVRPSSDNDKMASTKRKLYERYQEEKDAKRQRKIQVIEAPEMTRQRQRKMHPIMRERSRARCGSSMVQRSLMFSRRV